MQTSIDISLYPLKEDYIPAIKDFIRRISSKEDIHVVRGDLSTQLFGDYDVIMDLLKEEIRYSWLNFGKGIFVIKFLMDDLRGLADD